jgi:hypothetical protein
LAMAVWAECSEQCKGEKKKKEKILG